MNEAYVGEIRYYGGTTAPNGWALCDGRKLPIPQNEVLYSLIGTKFGGNGRTDFALPDFRGRLPVGAGARQADKTYDVGETGGQETLTISHSQMPAHTHACPLQNSTSAMVVSTIGGSTPDPHTDDGLGKIEDTGGSEVKQYIGPDADEIVGLGGITLSINGEPTTGKAGDGKSQTNMMPYLAINMIIALNGIVPPRP